MKIKIYKTKKRVPLSPFVLNLSEEANKWAYLKTLLRIRV